MILALQAFFLVFVGVRNLNVLWFAAKVSGGTGWTKPVPLCRDVDLTAFI